MRYFLFILISLVLCLSCNIRNVINPPTAREKYERNYKGPDSLLKSWQLAYSHALQQPTTIDLPLAMTIKIPDTTVTALGYSMVVNNGQVLVVELDRHTDSLAFFVEIYERKKNNPGEYNMLEAITGTGTLLQTAIATTDTVIVLVQPIIHNRSLFRLRIYPQPAYLFPVAGKGNAAISSFWGAARDGGGRSHEGIDIMAARGTPLLAVADGRITSTGNRGLGGKQVWLREAIYKRSVYYAHLDSIIAQDGQQVKKGDTVGLVGNTGNAITTAPHLHFGVYGSGGAMDPHLFVKQLPIPAFSDTLLTQKVITRNNKNELKAGPAAKFTTIHTLPKNDTLTIVGKTQNWYYVKRGNEEGFILQSAVKTY